MKRLRVFAFAVLFLFTAAFSWAQSEARDENKPQQEQPEAKAPKAEKQQTDKPKEEAKPSREGKQEPDNARREESRPAGQREEARPAENPRDKHQPAATENGGHARPAGKSVHIPDDKFRQNFGRSHTIVVKQVIHETTIVPNQTQFVYGGYTFVFLDPWPTEWAYTDDCYIDYVDGDYFLYDALHPGIRIALIVIG